MNDVDFHSRVEDVHSMLAIYVLPRLHKVQERTRDDQLAAEIARIKTAIGSGCIRLATAMERHSSNPNRQETKPVNHRGPIQPPLGGAA